MEEINTNSELSKVKAAKIIQKVWRGYIDKQVFKYYCKLINFKNQGDPSIMLRCIDPREIELFDSAFGARIKFRLGGDKFPPNIYFKVFTFRPIQDMCANSPKDYNKIRKDDPRFIHNKNVNKNGSLNNKSYKRFENNGWRQVSDGMLTKMLSDPVTVESSNKLLTFNHDSKKRQENKRNKKKKRKLEWLKKVYNCNMLDVKGSNLSRTASENDMDTKFLVKKATESMIETFEKKGEDYIDDWAVDELLDWTSGLSFEEYSNDWSSFATTLGSDWKINIKRNERVKESNSLYGLHKINQTSTNIN